MQTCYLPSMVFDTSVNFAVKLTFVTFSLLFTYFPIFYTHTHES